VEVLHVMVQVEVHYMLNEGEVICDECNGTGFRKGHQCYKCLGKGKLDWISNAMEGITP